MLEIFICEDNQALRQQMEAIIQKYLLIQNLDGRIACSTAEPQEILTYLDQHSLPWSLFFLDIDLGSEAMNGLELALKFGRKTPRPNWSW